MGVKAGPTAVTWTGAASTEVLDHLVSLVPVVDGHTGWRQAVLDDLNRLRDVLIRERLERSAPDGQVALRERSHLLSALGAQRLQVMASSDVDRLAYDLRRLVVEVRAHLRRAATA